MEYTTTASTFERLYKSMKNSDLIEVYGSVLEELFRNPSWERGSGPVERQRIPWENGEDARTEDKESFNSPGLYIWGIDRKPLYVGITRGSFRKRFSRYIWSKYSQCKLAYKYEATLVSNGIDGFPDDIRDWYKRRFGNSKVRLNGAVRFAEEGISGIWFALLPHKHKDDIEELERALIPVAAEWNRKNRKIWKKNELINVEFNRQKANET